ncbi:unnamed protein product [Lactuca virosa]|uniref:Uncharacterized protein n=1 Tax=Lactuca virosa TaxID=75947 RepID=A0AAU9NNB4_9ASTR|nr:unnamed protein product [Lactuca virosa]CAH1439346.1 unnamed protein product [Lactuca virosa]
MADPFRTSGALSHGSCLRLFRSIPRPFPFGISSNTFPASSFFYKLIIPLPQIRHSSSHPVYILSSCTPTIKLTTKTFCFRFFRRN